MQSHDGLKALIARKEIYQPPVSPRTWVPQMQRRVLPALSRKFEDAHAKEPTDLDPASIHAAVLAAFQETGDLSTLPRRTTNQAPWVYFVHFQGKKILGKHPDLVQALLKQMHARPRASGIVALLHVFLREYPCQWPTFHDWLKGIGKLLECKILRLTQPRERVSRYHLLDELGSIQMSDMLFKTEEPISPILEDAGLTGELSQTGFVVEVYDSLLSDIRHRLREQLAAAIDLDRILEYSVIDREFRFEAHRETMANALLEPFQKRAPKEWEQQRIQKFLLKHIGDPRIVRGKWHGVSKIAQEVMLQWLVGATLNEFFGLLDRTADPHMWKYRHVFWDAYYKGRYIRDAWVVLGSRAQYEARRDRSGAYLRRGKLSGAASEQSVLLMRIGSLTICEWSHSGKCRIWQSGNRHAPRLHENEYYGPDLRRGDDFDLIHHGSEYGTWQAKLHGYIQEQTDIQIPANKYRPKD